MLIYSEISLKDFQSWAGARDTTNCLTAEQLDTIEEILTEIYPEGISETSLNDFLWFDNDTIAEWLGYTDFETLRSDSIPF